MRAAVHVKHFRAAADEDELVLRPNGLIPSSSLRVNLQEVSSGCTIAAEYLIMTWGLAFIIARVVCLELPLQLRKPVLTISSGLLLARCCPVSACDRRLLGVARKMTCLFLATGLFAVGLLHPVGQLDVVATLDDVWVGELLLETQDRRYHSEEDGVDHGPRVLVNGQKHEKKLA